MSDTVDPDVVESALADVRKIEAGLVGGGSAYPKRKILNAADHLEKSLANGEAGADPDSVREAIGALARVERALKQRFQYSKRDRVEGVRDRLEGAHSEALDRRGHA